jgi:hypothetical protein
MKTKWLLEPEVFNGDERLIIDALEKLNVSYQAISLIIM